MRLGVLFKSRWFVIATIVACQFVAFEVALRLAGGSEAAPEFQRLFVNDPRIGHRLRPGAQTRFRTTEYETTISINGQGIRDEELGPKAPNERRILVLGDSLVMAVQVEASQTFCRILQDRLNATHPDGAIRYRVINAGVQGYGPVEKYLFYKYVARAFDPDVVLIGLYPGNDVTQARASAYRLAGASADGPAAAPIEEAASAWVRRIVRRSMVLQIVRRRVLTLVGHVGQTPEVYPPLRAYLQQPPPEVDEGLSLIRECVSRIWAAASAQHAKTAVVLFPARFQVDDEDYRYQQTGVVKAGQTLLRDGATERFKTTLSGLNLPTLDTLPALREASRGGDVYFTDTAHFTPRGHQAIADALGVFLESAGLVARPEGAR
jgi:lysophospholipase L1-like esterase